MPGKKIAPTLIVTADEWQLIRRTLAFSRDASESAVRLTEEANGVFKRLSILEDIVVEWFEGASRHINELSKQIDRIERLMLLEKMERSQSEEAGRLREEIRQEQDDKHLQELLGLEMNNLHKYREREAKYAGEAPVSLLNLIEETNARIDHLRRELQLSKTQND